MPGTSRSNRERQRSTTGGADSRAEPPAFLLRSPELKDREARAVIIVESRGWRRSEAELAQDRIQQAAEALGLQATASIIQNRAIGLVRSASPRPRPGALLRGLGTRIRDSLRKVLGDPRPWVGIGSLLQGLDATAQSYDEANQALRFGPAVHDDPEVVLFEDVLPCVLLDRHPGVATRFASLIGGINNNEDPAERLIDTLQAFYDTGSMDGAARALGIHRHTVAYRLTQAERLLGRPVRRGHDRLIVQIAILSRKVSEIRGASTR